MPRSKINFDAVRRIGLSLPGVEASTALGAPALKVRGNASLYSAIIPSASVVALVMQFLSRTGMPIENKPSCPDLSVHPVIHQFAIADFSPDNRSTVLEHCGKVSNNHAL